MSSSAGDSLSNGATPILVVGHIRSGTKWLSNILCNHPSIAGVQSERARGILETNMFHRMQVKFDLRSSDDYIGFVELWRRTEFVRETGVDIDFLYTLNPRPLSFVSLFQLVMQEYAQRSDARYWLQKCDAERALEVIPQLSRPKVVTIRRDTVSVLQSLRHMGRNRDLSFSLLKSTPGIARMAKLVREVENRFGGIAVRYEDLKADPQTSIKAVCDYLELDYSASLLEIPYPRNTSFQDARPTPLSPGYARLLQFADGCSKLLPIWFLDRVLQVKTDRRPSRTFVSGTFGDLKNRLSDSRDYYS